MGELHGSNVMRLVSEKVQHSEGFKPAGKDALQMKNLCLMLPWFVAAGTARTGE
jgi:hypothetical protein